MSKRKGRNLQVVANNKPDWDDDKWWEKYDSQKYGSSNSGSVYKTSSYATTERCFHKHPAVEIDGFTIYGGSCSNPVIKDADIYVGFDRSMEMTGRNLPWNEGEEFLYPIQDMSAPKNPESFKKLIEWLAEQMRARKKVHIGCIGGHGRTGTVMAALVKHMTSEEDAINWVRQHYCKKAVETTEQIKFLADHFGIKKVSGSKAGFSTGSKSSSTKQYSGGYHQPGSLVSGNKMTVFSPMMQRHTLFTR